jgi:hypothetical protein
MTFIARLNRAVHYAAKIRWYDEQAEQLAKIKAKAAANNRKDGPALFTLG